MWVAAFLKSFWSFLVLASISTAYGRGQSPPRALPGDHRQFVPSGKDLHLPCPVEPAQQGSSFFEWFRGERASVPVVGSGERVRVSSQGALRIRSTVREDTDTYICRAVNGFGSVDVSVTIIILAGDEEYEDAETSNLHPEGDDSANTKRSKPELVKVTQQEGPALQRPVGSTLRLKCEGSGNPLPHVTWLKDGRLLVLQGETKRGSQPSRARRWGRWTLHLTDLMSTDSGIYTCLVHNPLGDVNATFLLQVVERTREKPELEGEHPINTTVTERSAATLKCTVRSLGEPHIQWLKRVNLGSSEDSLIQVEGESYRTLPGSSERVLLEGPESPDHVYLNKLHIADASTADSGKYVCLAANSLGYSFRSAHLTVTSRGPKANAAFNDDSSLLGGANNHPVPFPIVVAASVLAIAVIVCIAAILIRCRHRRRSATGNVRKVVLSSEAAPQLHLHGHSRQLLPSGGREAKLSREVIR